MAEIYTKPFESVQAAINLFEQKIDPKKGSAGSNKEEKGGFLKDLIDCSLLLEAVEHEKNLTFFEFDASSKSPEELFTLLKLYKAERDNYKEKFRKSQAIFLEYEKGEHSEADESRTAAQRKTEMMKTELSVEEEHHQELLISSQLSNMEAKKLSSALNGVSGERKFEVLIRQFDEIEYLEKELLRQIIMSDYLHVELKQSKEAQSIFSEAVWGAMNELDLVKSENEQMKQLNSENENYILEIEDERRRMKEELTVLSEKINGMDCQIEMLVDQIQRMQEEMSESKSKELEFQPIVVTTLTPEFLHNSSSRITAAEESVARFNQAMQQLAVEAKEAKTRARRPAEYNEAETENGDAASVKNSAFIDADSNGFCTGITISMEEYEFLIRKSEMADGAKIEPADGYVVEKLRGELEEKNAEISELKCMLEEAERRAVLAEEAKVAVETQLRKWRDQRRMRRAASDAVKDYCAVNNEADRRHEKPLLSKLACINPEPDGFPSHPKRSASLHGGRKSKHVPLGKLLKIKF